MINRKTATEVLNTNEPLETFPAKVFVYGTLKEGKGNHRTMLSARGKLLGLFIISKQMYSMGGYPAVALDREGCTHGEVYEVPDATGLDILDGLEGYPTFYTRDLIDTPFGKAWVYHIPGDELEKWGKNKTREIW